MGILAAVLLLIRLTKWWQRTKRKEKNASENDLSMFERNFNMLADICMVLFSFAVLVCIVVFLNSLVAVAGIPLSIIVILAVCIFFAQSLIRLVNVIKAR